MADYVVVLTGGVASGKSEVTRVDLNRLVRDTAGTWAGMSLEKWKLRVETDVAAVPLWVRGDLSHLQQAVENLVFNARDATIEMRNNLVDAARTDRSVDPAARRQRLIEAYGWKGEVALATHREGSAAVLEVRDNGVGMTEEVRRNCLRTHFSTKRDNATYEGHSTVMGLGLSFVIAILENHGATLTIESQPLHGATFTVRFPPMQEKIA